MKFLNFNYLENSLSTFLYKFPRLRKAIVYIYIRVFLIFNFKRISEKSKYKIKSIGPENDNSFFGYYDCNPSNSNGLVLCHHTKYPTSSIPKNDRPIFISIFDITKENIPLLTIHTFSYNWQQGSRLTWINNSRFIYNDFDFKNKKYISKIHCIDSDKTVKKFPLPNYAVHLDDFFLSLETDRLSLLQKDYGYFNRPAMSLEKSRNLNNDGITYVDIKNGESKLLFKLEECFKKISNYIQINGGHVINHLLISDAGDKFVFLYRVITKKRRIDFLMKYEFNKKKLNMIIKPCIISHYCWIDEDNLLVFMYLNKMNGKYYRVNTNTGEISNIFFKNKFDISDGHPSKIDKQKFITDTYPNRDRLQKLLFMNIDQNRIEVISEIYNDIKFRGINRCDVHPRFDKHNKKIFFDSVHNGERKLNCIDYD